MTIKTRFTIVHVCIGISIFLMGVAAGSVIQYRIERSVDDQEINDMIFDRDSLIKVRDSLNQLHELPSLYDQEDPVIRRRSTPIEAKPHETR